MIDTHGRTVLYSTASSQLNIDREVFADTNARGQHFYFGRPKFSSVVSLMLCGLWRSVVTPDTPVRSSPAAGASFSLLCQSQSLRSLVSALAWRSHRLSRSCCLKSCHLWRHYCVFYSGRAGICAQRTDTVSTQNVAIHHFWKIYGNKLVFIKYTREKKKKYTRLEQMEKNVNGNDNHTLYNEPLTSFKLWQLCLALLIVLLSKYWYVFGQ